MIHPVFIFIATFVAIIVLLSMRPRRFYIVRHGETVLNAKQIRQGKEGSLSENGKSQADRTGKYLKQFSIKYIIASSYLRTQETAMIINKHLKVPMKYSPLFGERRNPTDVVGKH